MNVFLDIFMGKNDRFDQMAAGNATFLGVSACTDNPVVSYPKLVVLNNPAITFFNDSLF